MDNNINQNAIRGRLQTPVNDGTRKDVYLITTSDEVLIPNGDDEAKILTNVLNDIHSNIVIGSEQPQYPTVWFRVDDDGD